MGVVCVFMIGCCVGRKLLHALCPRHSTYALPEVAQAKASMELTNAKESGRPDMPSWLARTGTRDWDDEDGLVVVKDFHTLAFAIA